MRGGDFIKKLTDLQRQRVITEYAQGGGLISQQNLADKYGVSKTLISNILRTDKAKKAIAEQKEENAQTMREFRRKHMSEAQELVLMCLSRAKELIPDANLHDTVGAMKIISETFDIEEAQAGTDYADMSTLAQMLKIDEGEGDGEV